MAKLYVFGIGGTGSRVIKALAMLLAAGVRIQRDIDTVVPIIIDPDTANGDMNRTADILTTYQEIKRPFETENCGFFDLKIKTLPQLVDGIATNIADNFKFKIYGTNNQKFKDFIGYNDLEQIDKDFCDLLFSNHNLESSMDVGFKGNPNIGSVVLNQFPKSLEFKQFIESFGANDRIFIISSIFGGTGAAGFPLLLKNLREANVGGVGHSNLVRDSLIGAISYLPYFKIKSADGSEISSSTFLGKAKAALSYYEKSIVQNNRLNAFYYLGDHDGGMYDNNDGRALQKNQAHFLELAGALAVIDFLHEAPALRVSGGKAVNPIYREFGVESALRGIGFKAFGKRSFNHLTKPLSQLALFSKFLDHGLHKSIAANVPWVELKRNGIPKAFFNDYYFENYLRKFMNYYNEWIAELEGNSPSFKPFNRGVKFDNVFEMIEGFPPKNTMLNLGNGKSMRSMVDTANATVARFSSLSNEAKFVKLFHSVTEKNLSKKVGLK